MTYNLFKYDDVLNQYFKQKWGMSDEELKYVEYLGRDAIKEYETATGAQEKTEIRQNQEYKAIDDKWISQNLDLILLGELPNYSQENRNLIKQRALELQNINLSALKNIDFRILQEKYLRIFTKDQIAQIVSYPVIQEAILDLNDKELECLDVAVKDYIEREKILFGNNKENEYEPTQWAQMTERYLVALISNQYAHIINDIGNVENDERRIELYKKLGYIMTDPNVYEIKTIEQLENYDEIRKEVVKKVIYDEDLKAYPQLANMNEITRKRFAIMQRYGISSGLELSKMFDDDISQIPAEKGSNEETQIEYVLAIKELYKMNEPKNFREIFELLETANVQYIPTKYSNQKILEKKLKLLYERTYNHLLTRIEDLEEISEARREQLGLLDYEGKVYEVGDDFNLMVTSLSPYIEYEKSVENFFEEWTRKDLKSQLACFSNISPQKLTTAPIPFTLLGFDRIQGIDMEAPFDIWSETRAMTPFSEASWFTLPSNNETRRINELNEIDARRIMPSYIPVKKRDGKLVQIENSKVAAEQFGETKKQGEKLPLVIIDEDRILDKHSRNEEEISEETLLELYNQVPSEGRKSAFQVIRDTLNKQNRRNLNKGENVK